MKLPNKLYSVRESFVYDFVVILNELSVANYSVHTLYEKLEDDFSSIVDFCDALDILFYLGKINIDDTGVLSYVA
ncbi:hypothetical protein SAMN05720764_11852 [Fibrobacter sp. UWH5]|uniref:ABC-three component system middle component 7 n=1 Tax=Fibrobacter sp. UWH5 TaxID=1896211 RepID=UPI00091D3221|nr:ABC-three component system middle component 7 [Fibrobacter sp. UWH5]SHL61593.1 hypothetical protein SAMN05720764_11852 [Fibrobacter sp. UWH5]